MKSWQRLSGIVALLIVLLGLCIWYGSLAPAPAVGAYPDGSDIATGSNQYVGSLVFVIGTVESTDPVQIIIETKAGLLRLTIHGVSENATVGDKLHVFGELRGGHAIEAENTVRVRSSGLWYTYAISLLGGLIVLARLIRDWTVDTDNWTLRPRNSECTLCSLYDWLSGFR